MRFKISAVAFFLIWIFSLAVTATPPSAIRATYDPGRGELVVLVQHNVDNRKDHFIKEVVVFKDGQQVASKSFDFQSSKRNQTMTPIKISVVPGDSLKVVATCNMSGMLEKTIVIE